MTKDMNELNNKIISIFVEWREHVETLTKWNGKPPADEGAAQIQALLKQVEVEARNELYEGGEQKLIQMLLEHGNLEVSESLPDNTVLIRVPKKTIRKYFDGELDSTHQGKGKLL